MGWPLSSEELSRFWQEGIVVGTPRGQIVLGLGPFEGGKAPASSGESFFLPGFFKNQMRRLKPARTFRFHWNEIGISCPKPVPEIQWEEPSFTDFRRQVLKAQELFQDSELKKVVPCVRWRSAWRPSEADKQSLLENLITTSKNASSPGYVYAYWNSTEGFLGRTPELLFSRQGKRVNTMALAGTHWAGKAIEIMNDPKEREEHQWVVEEILEKLSPFGEFQAETLQTLKYGMMEHLYTPIAGTLTRETPVEELCRKLHPTPALGGYPQEQAWSWLRDQPEACWRGDFGAPLVYQSDEEVLALVLIRGLFWNSSESFIPCGCGIVAASQPESEWQELHKKKESVLQILRGLKI